MTPKTFPRELVDLAIAELESEARIYDYYPGRGMMGSTCFGVVMSDVAEAVKLFLALAQASLDAYDMLMPELDGLAIAMRTDSLGHDAIIYFPGWTLA